MKAVDGVNDTVLDFAGLTLHVKAKDITRILAAKPNKAVIKTSDGYREVTPESVGVDDIILVTPGEKAPLDGKIPSGNSQLDSSVLTDDFMPVTVKTRDTVLAGQINKSGPINVNATARSPTL